MGRLGGLLEVGWLGGLRREGWAGWVAYEKMCAGGQLGDLIGWVAYEEFGDRGGLVGWLMKSLVTEVGWLGGL